MAQERCYPIGTEPLSNKLSANISNDYAAKLNITPPGEPIVEPAVI